MTLSSCCLGGFWPGEQIFELVDGALVQAIKFGDSFSFIRSFLPIDSRSPEADKLVLSRLTDCLRYGVVHKCAPLCTSRPVQSSDRFCRGISTHD